LKRDSCLPYHITFPISSPILGIFAVEKRLAMCGSTNPDRKLDTAMQGYMSEAKRDHFSKQDGSE